MERSTEIEISKLTDSKKKAKSTGNGTRYKEPKPASQDILPPPKLRLLNLLN